MNENSDQPAHDRNDPNWDQGSRPPRTGQRDFTPTAYSAGGPHEQPHLGDLQPMYPAWYPTRENHAAPRAHQPGHYSSPASNVPVGAHPTAANPGYHVWSAHPGPAPGGHNTQDYPPYHPPHHAPYPLHRESQYGTGPSWPTVQHSRDGSERRYPHILYPPAPHSSVPDEGFPAAQPLQTANVGQRPSQTARGRRQERASVVSRSPSLPLLGPYTSTVLHPSRDVHTVPIPHAELVERPPMPILYGETKQHGGIIATRPEEDSSRPAEAFQFVVPSSGPRTASTIYPSSDSQASTPRTSRSPEVSTETKPKRRRANAAQLQLLNETHARTMFPTTEERAEIAKRIHMTPRQVQIWFQNRRQASRQNQAPDPLVPLEPHAPGPHHQGSGGPSSATSEHAESRYSSGVSHDVDNDDD